MNHQIILYYKQYCKTIQQINEQMKFENQFYLEIKHNKNYLKLPVYTSDTFEKLVQRLIQMTKSPSSKHIKMAQRLRQQLVALSTKISISESIQSKIKNLLFPERNLRESKEEFYKLNQTPFRILQDSLLINANQKDKRNKSKSFKYLEENAVLKMKYSSQNHEPIQPRNPYLTYQPSPLRYQQRSNSPFFNGYKRDQDDATENLVLKCEALEKKCNDYISKNIKKQKNGVQTCKLEDNQSKKTFLSTNQNVKLKENKSQIDKKFSNLYLNVPDYKKEKQTHYKSTNFQKIQTNILPVHGNRRQRKYNYLADS